MSKYVIMGDALSFTHKGQMFEAERRANMGFDAILKALQEGNYEEAARVHKANVEETKNLKIKGNVMTVKGTDIRLGETYVEAYLYAKHLGKAQEAHLDLFFSNVAKNPDKNSRDGLSNFLAQNMMPITDRGTFLAYRYVRADMMDNYTGTMDNMIGNEVVMDRSKCNSNPNYDCSTGLHVAQHEYFGQVNATGSNYRYVVAEINPRDVVAVPHKYSSRKMRVCRFRVLCTLDYFKKKLLICEQAALGRVPLFLTEQTRSWVPNEDVPQQYLGRYNPVDAWEWAAK